MSGMEITVAIVGTLAWPVVLVAIGLIVRRDLNNFARELKEEADRRARAMSIKYIDNEGRERYRY